MRILLRPGRHSLRRTEYHPLVQLFWTYSEGDNIPSRHACKCIQTGKTSTRNMYHSSGSFEFVHRRRETQNMALSAFVFGRLMNLMRKIRLGLPLVDFILRATSFRMTLSSMPSSVRIQSRLFHETDIDVGGLYFSGRLALPMKRVHFIAERPVIISHVCFEETKEKICSQI